VECLWCLALATSQQPDNATAIAVGSYTNNIAVVPHHVAAISKLEFLEFSIRIQIELSDGEQSDGDLQQYFDVEHACEAAAQDWDEELSLSLSTRPHRAAFQFAGSPESMLDSGPCVNFNADVFKRWLFKLSEIWCDCNPGEQEWMTFWHDLIERSTIEVPMFARLLTCGHYS
jgi:hypothetical protein